MEKSYKIAVIPGDGIGPEITNEAILTLNKVSEVFGGDFQYITVPAGTAAVEQGLPPFPEESRRICQEADAVLMGKLAVGRHPELPFAKRPESILADLRALLELKCDIRPYYLWEALDDRCPLRKNIRKKGMHIIVVRDIAGGMFAAGQEKGRKDDGSLAWDTERYSVSTVEDSARIAFDIARTRGKQVTSLDKAILLSSSVLWRETMEAVAKDYPDVTLKHMLVDHAALQLVTHPDEFDVIVASNVFGDIISDEIAGLTGVDEFLPAASLSTSGKGLYVPNQLHAPHDEQVGKHMANPIGLILAAQQMVDFSFHMPKAAKAMRKSVKAVLNDGLATEEFYENGKTLVTMEEMGQAIRDKLEKWGKDYGNND